MREKMYNKNGQRLSAREIVLIHGGNEIIEVKSKDLAELDRANMLAMIEAVHWNAKDKGFYDGEPNTFGDNIALMHSELSEAFEEHRNRMPHLYFVVDKDGNQKPEGTLVELADVVIRIFDYVGSLDKAKEFVDIIHKKHEYNQTRTYRHGNKKL